MSELDGIGKQVQQNLAQSRWIPQREDSRGAIHFDTQIQALDPAGRPNDITSTAQNGFQIEGDGFQLEFARVNLGKVEDVVDHGSQCAAGGLNGCHQGALLRAQVGFAEQIGGAQDSGHGRPQLMAHIRQELSLGLAGTFGHPLGGLNADGLNDQQQGLADDGYRQGVDEDLIPLFGGVQLKDEFSVLRRQRFPFDDDLVNALVRHHSGNFAAQAVRCPGGVFFGDNGQTTAACDWLKSEGGEFATLGPGEENRVQPAGVVPAIEYALAPNRYPAGSPRACSGES